MKPTIGRIVIYNDSRMDQSPAIIQKVAPDGSVRLFVFTAYGQSIESGLTQGDGERQWNWPKREVEIKPEETVLA